MEVYVAIQKLRSVRRYRPDKIPEDILNELLSAMRLAPSGGNRQPYKDRSQWHGNTLENQEPGIRNEKKHPWILPRELWEQGPLAGIRAGTRV